MKVNNLKPAGLARLTGVTPATVTRVLAKSPPAWSAGFTEIVDFVNSQKGSDGDLISLASSLRDNRETARAAAALLRAVAALLDKS